jgi:hypothetical protein
LKAVCLFLYIGTLAAVPCKKLTPNSPPIKQCSVIAFQEMSSVMEIINQLPVLPVSFEVYKIFGLYPVKVVTLL